MKAVRFLQIMSFILDIPRKLGEGDEEERKEKEGKVKEEEDEE